MRLAPGTIVLSAAVEGVTNDQNAKFTYNWVGTSVGLRETCTGAYVVTGIPYQNRKLWRSMRNFSPDPRVESIAFTGKSLLSGQDLRLTPFTVICGPHGSGKSTFLGYLAEGLCRDPYGSHAPPFIRPDQIEQRRTASLGGAVDLSLYRGGENEYRRVSLDEPVGDDVHSDRPEHVCVSLYTPYDLFLIREFFDNFFLDDMPEDDDSVWIQDRKDLDALRAILGVPYEEVKYIPCNMNNGAPIFPFVQARVNGQWRDCCSMSLGELSVHRLRWEARFSWKDDILLLDEPDANISPRGHAALIDELARLARISGTQIVMTTHSPASIGRVPLEFVRLCLQQGSNFSIAVPDRQSDLRTVLGLEAPLRYFIVVEDEVAETILGLILSAHGFSVLDETEILRAGPWSDVLTTVAGLSNSRRTRSAAVLDGDQRRNKAVHSPGKKPFFLPSHDPPEKGYMNYAFEHPGELSKRLHCTETSIGAYITEMLGEDHHRWLPLLSRRTGQDWRYCLRAAFEIWESDPRNRQESEQLARELEQNLCG